MTKRKRNIYVTLSIILVVLVAFRIALPSIAKNHINKKLNDIEGYRASIEGINMSLFRGAFAINDLLIYEEASSSPDIPFVRLPRLDFNIAWKALLKGKIVSEIFIDGLEVNFVKYKKETPIEEDPRVNFAEQLKELSPIEINKLEVTNSTISYQDPTSSPKVNVFFNDFNLFAQNLTNVENPEIALPASIEINSKAMGEGSMVIIADLNLLKQIPDFDINTSFENIDLVLFNDFMEAYANLNVDTGILNVYAEMVAVNGDVAGYVKPVIENFSVDTDDEDRTVIEKIYEKAVDIAANVLENRKKERVASRVEIKGNIENIDTSIWQPIFSLLRNAFIEAYSKEIENAIHYGNTDRDIKQK